MAKKNKKSKKQDNNSALLAGLVAGGAGLLVGLVMLARRGKLGDSGPLGAIDRALGVPSGAAGDGGSTAADLTLDSRTTGPATAPQPTSVPIRPPASIPASATPSRPRRCPIRTRPNRRCDPDTSPRGRGRDAQSASG